MERPEMHRARGVEQLHDGARAAPPLAADDERPRPRNLAPWRQHEPPLPLDSSARRRPCSVFALTRLRRLHQNRSLRNRTRDVQPRDLQRRRFVQPWRRGRRRRGRRRGRAAREHQERDEQEEAQRVQQPRGEREEIAARRAFNLHATKPQNHPSISTLTINPSRSVAPSRSHFYRFGLSADSRAPFTPVTASTASRRSRGAPEKT
mmetsp:Transcript_7736/g.25679  ORF Transcript_7736/g.25679 Transcript_7736/m.25679 type:complete len:206 (+) Transcript_7736:846-1463(+)